MWLKESEHVMTEENQGGLKSDNRHRECLFKKISQERSDGC